MGSDATMLAVRSVTHDYGAVRAVDDVSLTVEVGELLCLVGPSGCGKSTLLRLIAGLEDLQAGEIAIGGQVVADTGRSVPPERRGVGLLFQDYALFPHLDVAGNVAFGLRDMPGEARRRRALEVLGQVGMAEQAAVYPHTLSGGQQQRVALARALAPSPSVMLLDEPFSGLDQRLREQVRDQAFHVLKESGAATVLVTHDPEEAMFMADRIAVMRDGRIEQIGTPVEIYFSPQSAFVACFFSEVNTIPSVVDGRCADTPFGPVPSNGFEDGAAVDVLIRPEALRIRRLSPDSPDPAHAAKVLAARVLGRTSLVHLCVGEDEYGHLHMHSRVPGRLLPLENEVVEVDLDVEQAFVFPRENTK